MKYRVFDKNRKQHCDEDEVQLLPSGKLKIYGVNVSVTNNYRVEVSTGIFDVNGKEIFQNDKIENNGGRQFYVEWCYDRFQYREIYDGNKLQVCPQNGIGNIALCRIVPYSPQSEIDEIYQSKIDTL